MLADENQNIPESPPQHDDQTSTVFLEEDVDFALLYEQSLKNFKENQIVTGKVIGLGKDYAKGRFPSRNSSTKITSSR